MTSFDHRNIIKKQLNETHRPIYIKSQEVRLTHFGKNIGSEQDGKEESFVRPVLVIKKIGAIFFCVPMTTGGGESKYPEFYHILPFDYFKKESRLILSQVRTIDKRRFIKKIGFIHANVFLEVKEKLKALLL